MSDESEKPGVQPIGRTRFERISAVEGLQLSFTARAEFERDDRRGVTPAERRKRIIAKYLKG
jgi:hypothetical protein